MVNCALANTDWRYLTFYQYQALMTVWNRRHDPDHKETPDLKPLRKLMEARGGGD